MRDDELRATIARADRPRAMRPEEEAAVLGRILGDASVVALRQEDSASDREDGRWLGSNAGGRSGFWLATAAAILAVVAFGIGFTNRTDGDQAALLPGTTTLPCTVVGTELALALEQWGSVSDWAVATNNPEPDLALLAADALRASHLDPASSAALADLDDILSNIRPLGAVEVADRTERLERSLVELADVVAANSDSCLAPGLERDG